VPAKALGRAIGHSRLRLKRDDLIGFGFGGYNVRALELLLADALERNADVIVTGAGPQPNHVCAAADAAAHAGLKLTAVLWEEPPALAEGNLALTRLFGAHCQFIHSAEHSHVDRGIAEATAECLARGHRPHLIPRGGACALGALGHTLAALELAHQSAVAGIEIGTVVLAAGSGGTLAGWLLAKRLLDLPWRLEAVSVSRPATKVRENVRRMAARAAETLGTTCVLAEEEIPVRDGFAGQGYGVPSPEGNAARMLAASKEGVLLDPTYTGKALAGLSSGARGGDYPPGDELVFLHTDGEPAVFARPQPFVARLSP
jgi:1-aminocyclopropane-1-carboxylate deaminase/D-cysteine desulfhydrase-like pyridoxal-dependent ACC family enzyme